MSNRINLDDVFRSGLASHDLPFDEGAWASMQEKLAKDTVKPKLWIPFFSKKSNKIFVVMTLLILIFSSLFWVNSNNTTIVTHSLNTSVIGNNFRTIVINSNYNFHNSNPVSISHIQKPTMSKHLPPVQVVIPENVTKSVSNLSAIECKQTNISNYGNIQPESKIDPLDIKPKFRNFVDESQDTGKETTGEKHYNHPTLGVHFHYVSPMKEYANIQIPGMGFDLEGYSGNLIHSNKTGLFVGLSGSIAWMGKSQKTNITLSTPNNDPGKTYLQSNMGDVNLVGKMEFGKGDVKFYATLIGGWRFHTISQSIQSNKPISGFENSSNSIWTKSALQWGGAAGIRYHFAPGISLDIRGTYQDADFMRLANTKESVFDVSTAKYKLNYNVVEPKFISIKIGFLFCIDNFQDSGPYAYSENTTFNKKRSPFHINISPKITTPQPVRIAPKVNN